MSHVVVIGCGIVGASIAYELSQIPDLRVTVLDQQPPAQGSTGSALGVLMGVISHKTKGRAWQMREASFKRYETLIPELEELTGRPILFNRKGILRLCFAGEDLTKWQQLVEIRQTQGWQLNLLDPDQIQSNYPQINCENVIQAVYSPQDRQLDPAAFTLALVEAAKSNGVTFKFGVAVEQLKTITTSNSQQICDQLLTTTGKLSVDWVIVAAGLGTTQLLPRTPQQNPLKVRPVLGQAMQVQLNQSLGNLEPVITANDINIVPLGGGEYWIGATVEFPADDENIIADQSQMDRLQEDLITICPALAQAKVLRKWSGLRPRPDGEAAPVIRYLSGFQNILLATGHYRNGVLLAPATAQTIREMILKK